MDEELQFTCLTRSLFMRCHMRRSLDSQKREKRVMQPRKKIAICLIRTFCGAGMLAASIKTNNISNDSFVEGIAIHNTIKIMMRY